MPSALGVTGRAQPRGAMREAGALWRGVLTVPARRKLQVALGLIWLLDAALQFQPYMFGRSFVTDILEPAAVGNPPVVAHSLTWAAHLILHHVAWYNAVFATIQLALALGILYGRSVRLALGASVGWAALVWWFGEGLGGALAGATPVMGAPGAVILYAVVAVLVWPRAAGDRPPPARRGGRGQPEPTAFGGLIGRRGALVVWLGLWGSFAWYLLLPGNRSPSTMGAAVAGMAAGEPSWVRAVEHGLGRTLADHGTEVSVVLAVLCGLVALGAWCRRTLPLVVVVAVQLGLAIWVAEAFGGIFSGAGTDPNSGLLLVLLACCYWPVRGRAAPGAALTASAD